jgi:hypothetical protein
MGRRVGRLFGAASERRVIILVACCEGLVLIIALVTVLAMWSWLGP